MTSNMIHLHSTCNLVNVTINDFILGKSNEMFRVDVSTTPLLALSATQNILYSDTSIAKSLTVTSNVNILSSALISNRLQTSNIVSSNITLTCADIPASNTPFLRAVLKDGRDALSVTPAGITHMIGPVGIGITSTPQQALHVQGMIYSSSNIQSQGLLTQRIQGTGAFPSSNLDVYATNMVVHGNFSIQGGTFSFDDDLTLQNLRAKAGIFGERLALTNSNLEADPAILLNYSGDMAERYTYLDVQDVTLSNYALSNYIDEFLNEITLSNLSLCNVSLSNYISTASNLYSLVNVNFVFPDLENAPTLSNVSAFAVDTFGRVGMGTSEANALLHLQYREFNQACNIVEVHGRDDRVTVIDRHGQIGIGTTFTSHCLHIDPPSSQGVHPLIGLYGNKMPFLAAYSNQGEVLRMDENGSLAINKSVPDNTYFLDVDGRSRLQDLEAFYIRGNPLTCNIDFQSSQLSNISMMTSSNAYVSNLQSHSLVTNYIYGCNLSVVGFRCFSWDNMFSISLSNFWLSGQGMLMSPSSNDLQQSYTSDGKLKIMVNAAETSSAISRGINVVGPSKTGIRVQSDANTSSLELAQGADSQSNTAIFSYDGSSLSIGHKEYDFQQLVINRSLAGGSVKMVQEIIANGGKLGIQLGDGVLPSMPLEVNGNVLIRNNTTPLFYVSAAEGRIGIGTSSPNPNYLLHTEGGIFAKNDSRVNADFSVGGRIAVGTTIGNEFASIIAPATFTGSNALRVQNLSTTATTFQVMNSNTSAMIITPTGRIGVGTTTPQFTLHVNGDLNFDGSLYEKGSRYISSQWTSLSNQDLFFTSNVGIGTTVPNYRLHVQGTTYFSAVSTFGSNITSNGTMYAKGSFVSTSDRHVKANLQPISDAMAKVEYLTGYIYDRTDTYRRETGLIAQEVMEVLPEVVAKDDRDMYTIAYGNMAGLFVEAFKEMKKELVSLREEVAVLKQQALFHK